MSTPTMGSETLGHLSDEADPDDAVAKTPVSGKSPLAIVLSLFIDGGVGMVQPITFWVWEML